MKKTISVYWPLVIVVPLAAAAYLHLCGDTSHGSQAPLAADQLTAELARAVSYGMVGDVKTLPAKPMRAVASMPVAQAS
ncbi:hypothetical protein [Paraburkholderia lacunae]|uniref:Uncharacterized protein n=1 Tax=Paraburkholderia lacunae TaxID=2211104 RepID=A0A370N074_9BURK|nr:hypothetical protein [Paraburkholderia lacunae]RDJ99019.1 hypothetical protein DLM46_30980 [Paraburkholderia lacunae]